MKHCQLQVLRKLSLLARSSKTETNNQSTINEMCDFCLEQNTGITYRSLWGLAPGPWALHSWAHHICTTAWGSKVFCQYSTLCKPSFPCFIGLMTTLSKLVPEYMMFNVTRLIWHLNTGEMVALLLVMQWLEDPNPLRVIMCVVTFSTNNVY